jgi:hypothetical protein
MNRLMYDSTDINNIPADATIIATYANGRYIPSEEKLMRFPHARVMYIDVLGDAWERASILDVEPGCASARTAQHWVHNRNALHGDATVYCSRGMYPELAEALEGQRYFLWLATLDGSKPEVVGNRRVDLVQFQGGARASVDVSEIFNGDWPLSAGEAASILFLQKIFYFGKVRH